MSGQSAHLKIQIRVLLPLMILTVLSSLDRVNISFAALQMNASLGLSSNQYGFAVGIFFVGYLLFQFPSTWLQRRLGTRRWLLWTVSAWGVIAMAMASVRTPGALYVLRLMLGIAESGLAPGIVFYCSNWMPRRYRAGAITTTMLAIPISVVIGGPLSGWLLTAHNDLQWPGWRWMFLMEGLPTLAMGVLAYLLLADRPQDAPWLTPPEQRWLSEQLHHDLMDGHHVSTGAGSLGGVLRSGRVWAVAAVWFALLLGSNGIIFWLPQVLKQFSGRGDLAVGVMSTVPWFGLALGLVGNAWHSDKTQERTWHVGIAMLVGGISLAAAAALGAQAVTLVLLFIAGCGIGAAQGTFWAIPGNLWSGALLGSAITAVNLVGNLASLIGPYLIGALRTQTGSFSAPAYFLAAALALGVWPLLAHRTIIQAHKAVA